MKRTEIICTALTLMGIHYKLTGTGPDLSWLEVFLPLIIEGVLYILLAVDGLFNISAPIRLRIIKPILMWKFNQDIKKAHELIKKQGGAL
jgi:hypothetical protein